MVQLVNMIELLGLAALIKPYMNGIDPSKKYQSGKMILFWVAIP